MESALAVRSDILTDLLASYRICLRPPTVVSQQSQRRCYRCPIALAHTADVDPQLHTSELEDAFRLAAFGNGIRNVASGLGFIALLCDVVGIEGHVCNEHEAEKLEESSMRVGELPSPESK